MISGSIPSPPKLSDSVLECLFRAQLNRLREILFNQRYEEKYLRDITDLKDLKS